MLGKKPFKNAEVNPDPPKRDLRDRLGLIFSFFWFYRRVFIGLALLVGLYYVIDFARNAEQAKQQRMAEKAKARALAKANGEPSADTAAPRVQLSFDDEVPKAKSTALAEQREGDSEPAADDDSASTEGDLLELPPSIPLLIRNSIRLYNESQSTSGMRAFELSQQRANVLQQLLQPPLVDQLEQHQLEYSLTAYIDSIGLLDRLNKLGRLNRDGVEEAVREVVANYENHELAVVRARANETAIAAKLHDFQVDPTDARWQAFVTQADARIDIVLQEVASAEKFASELIGLGNADSSPRTRKLIDSMRAKYTSSNNEQIVEFSKIIRERLLFDPFATETLERRLATRDDAAVNDLGGFLNTLEANPDCRAKIYALAFKFIRTLAASGSKGEARRALQQFEAITRQCPDQSTQNEILPQIERLKAQL